MSYFSFLFRDEGLSYHAFAAVAVCQFSFFLGILYIFIGPESDHWECLSVTHSLTDSLLFSKLD